MKRGKLSELTRKYTSARKYTGSPNVNRATPITVQPPFVGTGIFVFGSAKRPVSSDKELGMTCTPICPKMNRKKPNNYHPSNHINGIVSSRKRKTSKKLRDAINIQCDFWYRHNKTHSVPLIGKDPDTNRPAQRERKKNSNKYLIGKNKKRVFLFLGDRDELGI